MPRIHCQDDDLAVDQTQLTRAVQEFPGYNLDFPPFVCKLTSAQQQKFMVKVVNKLPG